MLRDILSQKDNTTNNRKGVISRHFDMFFFSIFDNLHLYYKPKQQKSLIIDSSSFFAKSKGCVIL